MIYLKKSAVRQTEYKGSITIFLALTLILILSFLFSMLEAARVTGLKELAKRKLELEMESLFGAYNQELWENYGLLFLDAGYGNGEPDIRLLEQHLMEGDYAEGEESHFYQMELKDAKVEKYRMATDEDGAEFQRQACRVAKECLTKEGLEYLKGQIAEAQSMETENGSLEQKWESALDAEEEAQAYKEEAEADGEEVPRESVNEALPENPIDYVAQLKASSLLAVVLENPSELSGKGIDQSACLNNRVLFCGNMAAKQEKIVDKLWFIQYLDKHCLCGTDEGDKGHILDYELEYCIAGKPTDAQNLEAVVKRLLLMREAGNFVTIMQDTQKKALALEIAVAAVGFTGLPPLIKAVEIGILLAWSYIESVLDVRSLLSGGKIPLVKDTSQWKSDLFHIQDEVEKASGTTEEKGLEYREYLKILLFLTGQNQLTYRAMDVVEGNIRVFSGNDRLRMDAMVSGIQVSAGYGASPLFLNLIPIEAKIDGNYYFAESGQLSY